jgi:hypothetical protein
LTKHLRRLAIALVAFAALPATAGAATPTLAYNGQFGNSAPLKCIGATKSYAGTISVSEYRLSSTASRNPHGPRVDGTYRLDVSYQASKPNQPSYAGSETVGAGSYVGTDGSPIEIAFHLTGSDGSQAVLFGLATPTASGNTGLLRFGSSSDWACDSFGLSSGFSAASVDPSAPAQVGLADRLAALQASVNGTAVGNVGRDLSDKLARAATGLASGKSKDVSNNLRQFIQLVQQKVAKTLPTPAASWIAEATSISEAVGS